jgi:hypothetical protein
LGTGYPYHSLHRPDLSPTTDSTAERHGSNTNKIQRGHLPGVLRVESVVIQASICSRQFKYLASMLGASIDVATAFT